MSARESIANHVQAMLQFKAMGIPCFDYGNNIRQDAKNAGVKNAFDYPGFVPAYIRPLFCAGQGPFRWVALSGDAEDIARTDAKVKELFPEDRGLQRWLDLAAQTNPLPGAAGAHLLARPGAAAPRRARVQRDGAHGRAQGADRHRPRSPRRGSVASPNRETEAMHDGTDAVSDWPLLNAHAEHR